MFTQNWQALPVYAKKPLARTGYSGRALPRRQRSHGHAVPAPGSLPPGEALQGRGPRRRGGAVRRLLHYAPRHRLLPWHPHGVRRVLYAGGDDRGGRRPSLAAKNLAPAERPGTYLALFGCCFGVGYGTSSIVAGLLLDSRFPHNVIWPGQLAMATLATAGLLVLARLRKRR